MRAALAGLAVLALLLAPAAARASYTAHHLTGFEAGTISATGTGLVDSSVGTPTVGATNVRSGSYSMAMDASNATAEYVGVNLPGSTTVLVARGYVFFQALPTTGSTGAFSVIGASETSLTQLIDVRENPSTNRLEAKVATGATASGPVIQASKWYRIDILIDVSTTTWTLSWLVDGIAQPGASYAAAAPGLLGQSRLGQHYTGSAAITGTGYFDDWATSVTDSDFPIGAGAIEALRPTGIGTHNTPGDFQDNDNTAVDATSYQRIDDAPINVLTDYVKQVVANATSYLEFTFGNPSTSNTANAVRAVVAYHASAAAVDYGETRILMQDASTQTVYAGDMGTTALTYKGLALAEPTGGWTKAQLDALGVRLGFSNNIASAIPYWDAVMLEVDVPRISPISAQWVVPGDAANIVRWDVSPDAKYYRIYRSTTSGVQGSLIATVTAPTNNYRDTSLTNGTTYYYTIHATDGVVESPDASFPMTGASNSWANASGSCGAYLNGLYYIFGGNGGGLLNTNGNAVNTVATFNPLTGAFTTLGQTLPTARGQCTAEAYNSKIYVFGGETPYCSGATMHNAILEFTPGVGFVAKTATLPTNMAEMSSTVMNGKIYIFGGRTGGTTETDGIFMYDPVGDTLTTLGVTLPVGAGGGAGTGSGNIGNVTYTIAGGNITSNACSARVTAGYATPSKTTITPTNTALTALGTARYGTETAVINEYLYYGNGGPSQASDLTTYMQYDPLTDTSSAAGIDLSCCGGGGKYGTGFAFRGWHYTGWGKLETNAFRQIYAWMNKWAYPVQGRGTPATPLTASPPSGLSATGGATQVSLSWTAGSNVKNYRIFRSTVPNDLGDLIEESGGDPQPPAVALVDASLGACTKYWYTMTAIGFDDHETAPLTQVSAVTNCGANSAPNAPSNLAQLRNAGAPAIPSGGWTPDGITNYITFQFDVSDPDASQTVTPWIEIQPNATAFSGTCGVPSATVVRGVPVTTGGAGTPMSATARVTGLVLGTQYHWRACAVDQSGTAGTWTSMGGSPDFGVDNVAPPATAGVRDGLGADIDSQGSTTTIEANWDSVTDAHSGLLRYRYCIGTSSGGCQTVAWTNHTSATTLTRSGLTLIPATTYYVSIRAVDNAGNYGAILTSDGVTISSGSPPNAPSNILPANNSASTDTTPTLTSSAFSDPDGGDTHTASQWQVRTGSGSYASPAVDSGTDLVNLTSYTTAALPEDTYWFHVRHRDNNSNWSNYSAETRFFIDLTAPSAPTNLANASQYAQPALSWTASTDATSGVWYYRVLRATGDCTGGYSQINVDGATTGTAYTDTTAVLGTSYCYKLRAVDNATNVSVDSAVLNTAYTTQPSYSWFSGLEHGVLSASGTGLFSQVNRDSVPELDIATAVVRNGSYSMKVDKIAGSSSAFVGFSHAGTISVARFAIRFEVLPAATVVVYSARPALGNTPFLRYNNATQRLNARIGANNADGTTPIVTGQWYVIDVRAQVGTDPRTIEWRINGVAQPTLTGPTEATSTLTDTRFGTTVSADQYAGYFDDMSVSTTSTDYPIGDGRIIALRPDGAGTHNTAGNYLDDDSSAIDALSWSRIDDSPASGTGEFVQQTSAGGASYLEWTLQDTAETGSPRAVRALVGYHSAGASANNGQTHILGTSTTDQTVQTGNMSGAAIAYKGLLVTPPGGGFTQAEVNSLKIRTGYSTDVIDIPYWDAALIEVEYPNTTPQSLSIGVAGYDVGGGGPHSAPATSDFGTVALLTTYYAESRVTVATEAANGYTLSAFDPDANGAIYSASAAANVPWVASGTVPAPAAWSGSGIGISAFAGAQTPARWCTGGQANCTAINDADLLWAPLTGSAQSISGTNVATTGDTTRIPMRLTVPAGQAAASYAGEVTFTATALP